VMLQREHLDTAKVFIPQVVLEELDAKRRHRDVDVSSRARAMMRYLEGKFKRARHERHSFWELQERETDDGYKQKVAQQSSGTRSCDLRIFYFVRDCHRQRPGCMTMVTNDQPLALEAASVGIPTISQQQLVSMRHVYRPPEDSAREGEVRGGREGHAGSGGSRRQNNGVDSVGAAMEKLSLEQSQKQHADRKKKAEEERQQKLAAVAAADETLQLQRRAQHAQKVQVQVQASSRARESSSLEHVLACTRALFAAGTWCRCLQPLAS